MIRPGIIPLLVAFSLGLSSPGEAQTTNQLPEFQEVLELVRDNLAGVTQQDLDHAAAAGLAMALSPRVVLVTNNVSDTSGPTPVTKSAVFEGPIGYVRIGRVAESLPSSLKSTCQDLRSTNKLKGIVLDLRFATGDDYPAAAAAADLFVSKEGTLLNWGSGEYRSKPSDDDVTLPVAVLVNRETAGAPEALAAMLRHGGSALVLGNKTAGQAIVSRDFTLKSGAHLRVAAARVMLGDGTALSAEGVAPDIAVQISARDEKAYYADAFKVIAPPELASASVSQSNAASGTNRVSRRPRFNEAELVRERREGITLDGDLPPARQAEPEKPVVRDPALARALDVLKGLAVVRQTQS